MGWQRRICEILSRKGQKNSKNAEVSHSQHEVGENKYVLKKTTCASLICYTLSPPSYSQLKVLYLEKIGRNVISMTFLHRKMEKTITILSSKNKSQTFIIYQIIYFIYVLELIFYKYSSFGIIELFTSFECLFVSVTQYIYTFILFLLMCNYNSAVIL